MKSPITIINEHAEVIKILLLGVIATCLVIQIIQTHYAPSSVYIEGGELDSAGNVYIQGGELDDAGSVYVRGGTINADVDGSVWIDGGTVNTW